MRSDGSTLSGHFSRLSGHFSRLSGQISEAWWLLASELYGGRMRERPEQVRRLMHDTSRVGSKRGYVMQLLAGVGWSSLPALPLIRQPVLILARFLRDQSRSG